MPYSVASVSTLELLLLPFLRGTLRGPEVNAVDGTGTLDALMYLLEGFANFCKMTVEVVFR